MTKVTTQVQTKYWRGYRGTGKRGTLWNREQDDASGRDLNISRDYSNAEYVLTVLTWFYSAENMTAKPRAGWAEINGAARKIEKAVLYFIHTDMVTMNSLTSKGEFKKCFIPCNASGFNVLVGINPNACT